MKPVVTTLLLLVAVYIGFGLILYFGQRSLLYYPTPRISHQFEERIFYNEGESINVIVVNQNRAKAILYFGGNGESVAFNAPDFEHLFPSHTVYLMNYRGYGGSSGTPEESGLYSDALYLFDQIKEKHAAVSVIGRSLGSGIATLVASTRALDKLILITPFDSIENVAQGLYRVYPASLLVKDKYDSLSRVKDITVPTLILIAENDRVIGRRYSMNLVSAFDQEQARVEIIKDTDHNTISAGENYGLLLKEFM